MKQYTREDWDKAKGALDVARRNEMAIREQIEEREVAPKRRALVGKCYRYRNNYSCPQKASDYWWMWVKVVGVDGGNIQVVQVQLDKYGTAGVVPASQYVPDGEIGAGYQPVTRKQYDKAVRAILGQAKKLAGPSPVVDPPRPRGCGGG